jgi:hypothetical protein
MGLAVRGVTIVLEYYGIEHRWVVDAKRFTNPCPTLPLGLRVQLSSNAF